MATESDPFQGMAPPFTTGDLVDAFNRAHQHTRKALGTDGDPSETARIDQGIAQMTDHYRETYSLDLRDEDTAEVVLALWFDLMWVIRAWGHQHGQQDAIARGVDVWSAAPLAADRALETQELAS